MIQRALKIENRLGLHARAAAKFVRLASRFRADIRLSRPHGNEQISGKSILGILMLAAAQGTELILRVAGDDENEAAAALEALVVSRFGEDA